MNDEEINRSIAEHLGYKRELRPADCRTPNAEFWIHPEGSEASKPPNFCGDLNAMHEAEKAAFGNSSAWAEFAFQLISVLNAYGMSEQDGMTCLLQATARQRAEAFLRTVGKWKENE
jgi:hypothetical protein